MQDMILTEKIWFLMTNLLVYCKPLEEDYGKEDVPIGIDLSGSILTRADGAYVEGAVLGINALAPHPEQVEIFLSYLFEKTE